MKLEIDLDMEKIDYDAINKQIQDKIDAMDIAKMYDINSQIGSRVHLEVSNAVDTHLRNGAWNGLNDNSKAQISNIIYKEVKDFVSPHIENILNQISEDELNDIISEVIPKVIVDLISSKLKNLIAQSYYITEERIVQQCTERIKSSINI